jgi:predicted NBD/HSP70 family sugar kinase
VREAGRVLGEVLAMVVTVVNPARLVVAGSVARAGGHLLSGVQEVVPRLAQYRTTRGLSIVEGRLGERAGIVGAASMVVDRVFSPEIVDARLAGDESAV